MKTLVIHPTDKSTTFLCPIYGQIEDATIVNSCEDRHELRELVATHDQILMMGHGSPEGLWGRGQFGRSIDHFNDKPIVRSNLAIDESFVDLLKSKQLLSVWCNADDFINPNKLSGFFTGMFISEVSEAYFFKIKTNQATVDESNDLFAKLVGESINQGLNASYCYVLEEYGKLAENNPVADYNWRRLYYYPN